MLAHRIWLQTDDGNAGFVSGTLGNETVIQGAPGGAKPVINIPGWFKTNDSVPASVRNHFQIKNLIVDGTGGTDVGGGELQLEGAHILVEGVEIRNTCRHGIAGFPVEASTPGSVLHHLTVRNSLIHHTNKCDPSQGGSLSSGNGYGIYMTFHDATVEGTEFHHITAAIQFTSSQTGNTVPRPRFSNNRVYDLQPSSGNSCWGVAYEGIDAQIVGNWIDGTTCTLGSGTGIQIYGNNGKIANNTILGFPNGKSITIGDNGTTRTGTVMTNNHFFGANGVLFALAGSTFTWTHNACATAHTCATSGKVNLSSITTCLVSSTNARLHALPNPCANGGTTPPTPFTVDQDGTSVPKGSGYPIGAFELNEGGDTTPPAAPTGVVVSKLEHR